MFSNQRTLKIKYKHEDVVLESVLTDVYYTPASNALQGNVYKWIKDQGSSVYRRENGYQTVHVHVGSLIEVSVFQGDEEEYNQINAATREYNHGSHIRQTAPPLSHALVVDSKGALVPFVETPSETPPDTTPAVRPRQATQEENPVVSRRTATATLRSGGYYEFTLANGTRIEGSYESRYNPRFVYIQVSGMDSPSLINIENATWRTI